MTQDLLARVALFNSDDYCPTGQQLKAWLTGGGVITTDKALFDVREYDGTILTDLFGEHGQFANVEHFWDAQNAAIAEALEGYKSEGWKEVILGERGDYFPRYDYVSHRKDQGGRVYGEIRESGEVTFHEGYITDSEAEKIRRALSRKPTLRIRPGWRLGVIVNRDLILEPYNQFNGGR